MRFIRPCGCERDAGVTCPHYLGPLPDTDILRDQVSALRAWANSRLDWCDSEIKRYGLTGGHDAVIEQRTLRAVLRILNGGPNILSEHQPRCDTRYGHEVQVGCTCGWRVDPETPDPDVDFTAHVALARVQEGESSKP
jgi:hypothetical protein